MRKNIVLGLAVAFGMTYFIFYHSLQPAALSNDVSGSVLRFMRHIFSSLHVDPRFLSNHVVRKSAHFTEFLLQAVFLCGAFTVFGIRLSCYMGYVLFLGLFTAVIDETIQLFVPGRAGMVQDVLLDFCGTFSGVVLFVGVLSIWRFWRICRGSIRSLR